MKKKVYIGLFALKGFMVSIIVHAIVEVPVIYLVIPRVDIPYSYWVWTHHVFVAIISIIGPVWGYRSGVQHWNEFYGGERGAK